MGVRNGGDDGSMGVRDGGDDGSVSARDGGGCVGVRSGGDDWGCMGVRDDWEIESLWIRRNPVVLDDDLEITISTVGELLNKRRRTSPHYGSVYGHAYIWRDRVHGHHKLFHDYFGENPVYSPNDAVGFLGLSSLQKITTAIRMLAYGVAADYVDEYVRIGESTAIESLKKIVKVIVSIFSEKYMRSPNKIDIARLLKESESRGFPRMLGSIDCMHWKWKNCPVAWKGMYVGHVRSHNDINVLERSFLFTDLAEGRAPLANYSINGHDYTMGYYLADGIYPPWSTFVKTIPYPQSNKHKQFAAAQESARKDVERAFGVLQAQFAIVRGPAHFGIMKL
ncbi:hypothetical protein FNV43_RR14582 [Rhamnella rubrinervis]|uniref:Nuclease HARBI1 n=1 Tax=Rhamnella rubrinervis TaxID=2594499 RepID=A0A8K0MFW1_9ROSA|nr:hypothetical protein FNV43_RR14582 [Rhamnella rubrinervis]